MRVVIAIGLALAVSTPSVAQDRGWRLMEYRLRFTFMQQEGHGFQSQAGPAGEPGSEHLLVFQPNALFRVRQNARTEHELIIPIDIVSGASPEALDAVSHASRENEAGGLDFTTRWRPTPENGVSARYGFHLEEPLRTFFFGFGYERSLADSNATLGINGNVLLDFFDPITPRGFDLGYTERVTLNTNVAFSQMLSRTTVASITYGLTYQTGTLETTWNAIPQVGAERPLAELFPDTRTRHAISGFLAQHIPRTSSTLRGQYRYYQDDIGIRAHTTNFEWYQYFGRRLLVRAHYRYHHQSSPDFFAIAAPTDFDEDLPRTADSDLASFTAHETGARLMILFPPTATRSSADRLDLDYFYYTRTNGLRIHTAALSYGRSF